MHTVDLSSTRSERIDVGQARAGKFIAVACPSRPLPRDVDAQGFGTSSDSVLQRFDVVL